jgi:hypothetical protein
VPERAKALTKMRARSTIFIVEMMRVRESGERKA